MSGKMSGALAEAEKLIVDDWFNAEHEGGIKKL
jgi:hypothetical protein